MRWLLALVGLVGCVPAVPRQQEIGTPAQRLGGKAVVVLPRTCRFERSVPGRHFRSGVDPDRRSSEVVRQALDALAGSPRVDSRPLTDCEGLPDLEFRPEILGQLRASEETLRLMHDREAEHAFVIEVRSTISCARTDSVLVAHYTGMRIADSAHLWRAEDTCAEDEVSISAWLFNREGKAVWALSHELEEHEDPLRAVQRVLGRVSYLLPQAQVVPASQ